MPWKPLVVALTVLLTSLPIAAPGGADDLEQPRRRFTRVRAPDGIQIRRYNKTNGAHPGKKDRVSVHYHGTLEDGTVFDSTRGKRHPAQFRLDQVIPCWTTALQLLRVGESAELTCPPDVGYGAKGSPPDIPPQARLIFEVELINIQ